MQQKEKSGMKWNKSTVTALQQIKDKKYLDSIQSYAGDVLLVGINYSKKEKNARRIKIRTPAISRI